MVKIVDYINRHPGKCPFIWQEMCHKFLGNIRQIYLDKGKKGSMLRA